MNLLKQSCVLDRDNRLVGERLHEFNLPWSERHRLMAHQRKDPFEFSVAQQGHAHHRAIVPDDLAAVIVVFLVLHHVGNENDLAQKSRASGQLTCG